MKNDLPMSETDQLVEQLVGSLDGRIRNCFRSAYNHLRKSWKLYELDNEMSAFRAITAEEEAASAVILAVKQRKYNGAEQLRERDHTHKAVVFEIVRAVNNLLSEIPDFPEITLRIAKAGKPNVQLLVHLPDSDAIGERYIAHPNNPLNVRVSTESPDGSAIPFLEEQIAQTLSESKFKDFNAYIRKMANARNQLLYASNEGYPVAEFKERFILERLERVRKLGLLTICILQDNDQHILVKECLEIVLTRISQLTPTGYDFSQDDAR